MTVLADTEGNTVLVTDARDKRERTVALSIPREDRGWVLAVFKEGREL